MKYLISLFLLVPCAVKAQVVNPVQEVAISTNSIIQTISVASQTVTDVAATTSSGTLSGYFAIEVYNLAANTNTLNCGFDVSLSTINTSAWYGREVPAGVGIYFAVPSYRKLYCQTQSTTASTRATITQIK